MKTAQFLFVVTLLHSAVTNSVHRNNRKNISIASDDHQDTHFWEKSGQIEGDMVLTPEQQEELYSIIANRNGVIDTRFRWPNRTIPYVFSHHFTPDQKKKIASVLRKDYARTCIRVVPRTNEADYVYVQGNKSGCWSSVGRIGGKQLMNLEPNECIYSAAIVHEFLHAAGFHHQQGATERDDYVTIVWDNIETDHKHNFKKYGSNDVTSYGQPYDYGSVMHYESKAFSKNGQETIIPKQNVEIGKTTKLSEIDIIKLNKMYDC